MQSSNLPQLEQLVTAATGWRNAGLTVNVQVAQINAIMPDGSTTVLYWDILNNDWNVVTAAQ